MTLVSRTLLVCLSLALAPAAGLAKGTFVYVNDSGTGEIHGFALAPDGSLAPVPGAPLVVPGADIGCGGPCHSLDFARKRALLFVAAETGVAVARVAPDGALELVPGSPFGATDRVLSVAAVEIGKRTFVYGTEPLPNQLRIFELQPDDTLAEISASPLTGRAAPEAVIDRGRRLAVVETDAVASFVIAGDGSLEEAPGSPLAVAANFFSLTADPKGSVLYVADYDAPDLHALAFDRRTAVVTPLPESPFDSGLPAGTSPLAASQRLVVTGSISIGDPLPLRVHRREKDGSTVPIGLPLIPGLGLRVIGFDARGRRLVLVGYTGVQVLGVERNGQLELLETLALAFDQPSDVELVTR